MHTGFEKIRCNGCTLYVNKDFRNNALEQALLAGEEELQQRYVLTTIPSSESSRVYRFTVSFGGIDRQIYFKQHLWVSGFRFIKYLIRTSRAKQAFNAMLMLAGNGFDVPAILAMGERRFGFFSTKSFLVTAGVEDSKSVYQYISNSARTKEQLRSKRELIRAFGRTIGKMHAKGISHGDLRLGNVLAKQEKGRWRFFFLDNERTKKLHRLPVGHQLKNLVQVNMKLPDTLTNTDRMRFFKEYWVENGGSEKEKTALIKKVLRKTNQRLSKKRRIRRELRKCLRKNARYLRIKANKHIAVFDRAFCQEAKPFDFIEQIDAMMDKGQILKNGDTSYVSRLNWNDKDVVVKRYNHKGLIHSLRHTIKRSRARRAWLHGHRLGMLNIATPKPLAYIEQYKGKLIWKSYLVTEYVKGRRLRDFLRDGKTPEQQRSKVTGQVKELLDKMRKYRITHGDLKHPNILVTDNGPMLTDLDGMKVHKYKWTCKIKSAKDVVRFDKDFAKSKTKNEKGSDMSELV